MGAIQFQQINPLIQKKSKFDLSYEHQTTCDMGQMVPIMIDECVPGDIWKMGNNIIVRMAPMIAPIFHPINVKTWTFFVPNRLTFPDPDNVTELTNSVGDNGKSWENFITGGPDGNNTTTLPLWNPNDMNIGSLWDYFGMPMNMVGGVPNGSLPMALPLRAYNMIWNEFFRDQNLQEKRNLNDDSLAYLCWEGDYFTKALPFQQRGTSPVIPLDGLGGASFNGALDTFISNSLGAKVVQNPSGIATGSPTGTVVPYGTVGYLSQWANGAGALMGSDGAIESTPVPDPLTGTVPSGWYSSPTSSSRMTQTGLITNQAFKNYLANNTIDFGSSAGVDIHIMRTGFQTQKWLERNARCGARYTEQLQARFNETAGDARLQRPEFIGGTKTPIIISEVLQTAQNPNGVSGQPNSALGVMGGHGITADDNHIGTYKCKEHGWMITVMGIRPDTMYCDGMDIKFTRRSRYEYLTPEFVNLSEQAVYNREIFCDADESYNSTIFGYQGRYNEYRYNKNRVTGLMRNDFSFWNLARRFEHTQKPELNSDFLTCKPDKRIFAVPSEPGFFINYGAINHVIRALPIIPEPGLIDHH